MLGRFYQLDDLREVLRNVLSSTRKFWNPQTFLKQLRINEQFVVNAQVAIEDTPTF
jgi:hypothetical protein